MSNVDVLKEKPSVDFFIKNYYLPRKPVVFPYLNHVEANKFLEKINNLFKSEALESHKTIYWWNIPDEFYEDFSKIEYVESIKKNFVFSIRDYPMRVWKNLKGHKTPWHYDFGSIEVFNLQIKGSKTFYFIDPTNPLKCRPFSTLCKNLFHIGDEALEVRVKQGDVIYIPRHWYHTAETTSDEALNLQWFWSDLSTGPIDNPTSQREFQIFGSLYPGYRLLSFVFKEGSWMDSSKFGVFKLTNVTAYGGRKSLYYARSFWKRYSYGALLKRLFLECAEVPSYFFYKKSAHENMSKNTKV